MMMTTMFKNAGLTTKYTNHSLRDTSVPQLFFKNVPEKIIQEKSGHRSLAGLHAYKHTTSSQECAVKHNQTLSIIAKIETRMLCVLFNEGTRIV